MKMVCLPNMPVRKDAKEICKGMIVVSDYRPTMSLYVDHPAITANAASTPMIEPNHAYPYSDHCQQHCLGEDNSRHTCDTSWPGTCTFIPQRPVTRFMGMSTVPSAVSLDRTSLIWLLASVISMEICAR